MVGLVTKVMVGLGLFVGSLFGGLALTGRLNHEGTANIPVLGSFFPASQSAAETATAAKSAASPHEKRNVSTRAPGAKSVRFASMLAWQPSR